jgi:CBS domain-containing protein
MEDPIKKTLLKQIMKYPAITLDVDSHFSKVEEFFRLYHIRHLPIVDKNNCLLGIITQRDLYRLYSPHKTMEGDMVFDKNEMDQLILKYVMTPNPLALKIEDTVARAIQVMATHKYGCIPIVDNANKVLGVVTQIDILRFFYSQYVTNE